MTADDLVELHAIHALKYRYIRGLDTRDWPLLESCFTEDVVLWPNGGSYIARGRESVMQLIRALVTDGFYASHIITQPEIDLIAPDRARGRWRLQDTIFYTAPHPAITHREIKGGEMSFGAAYYHDDYMKQDGEWRIAGCGFVRIYEAFRTPGETDLEVIVDERRGLMAGEWPR